MADTLGDVAYRISKTHPAVDRDYLVQVINERYAEIIRAYPWSRLTVDATLQTTAVYSDGTVAVTNGANTVVGTGTTFTSGMTGREFRLDNGTEIYVFTFVDPTNGTLDRNFEGDTDTAATYRIFKRIYVLPADVGVFQSLRVPRLLEEADQMTQEQLDEVDPARTRYGRTETYALFEDDSSTPPAMQIELYPIPEDSEGLPYRYTKYVTKLSALADYILPWVSTECLVQGVLAELDKDTFREQRFMYLLGEMKKEETRRLVPQQIKMADRFVQHRKERSANWRLMDERRRNQM